MQAGQKANVCPACTLSSRSVPTPAFDGLFGRLPSIVHRQTCPTRVVSADNLPWTAQTDTVSVMGLHKDA